MHAPFEADAAYVVQILDCTADIYKDLQSYLYHGSVYGIIASKRGFLNPMGEWNTEEVVVKCDDIQFTMNGILIMEGSHALIQIFKVNRGL